MHHSVAISQFKLELQSGNTQCRIRQFVARIALKLDGWSWKTTGHLLYATSRFVNHFIAICKYKLELPYGNAQSGAKLFLRLSPWPWPFVNGNNSYCRTPHLVLVSDMAWNTRTVFKAITKVVIVNYIFRYRHVLPYILVLWHLINLDSTLNRKGSHADHPAVTDDTWGGQHSAANDPQVAGMAEPTQPPPPPPPIPPPPSVSCHPLNST